MAIAPTLDQSAIDAFSTQIRGNVITASHPGYDEARTIYNAMIDKRPEMIVRCVDVADVIHAVNFARDSNLPLAIRGGGHNVAGLALVNDGLVIDLSAMKSVQVDPVRKRARVEGGATWGDFDHATHAFGLATPTGIISTTGVAGLTLGGGFGHLSRHYGLSCDNLISADMVLADGTFTTASKDQNPDLFWAIRGGGGNFGVVTTFEFQLHPVHTVYGGPLFYPVEHTETLLRFFRDYMREAPDAMTAFFGFHQGPPAPFIPEHLHWVPMVTIMTCYSGPLEQGEQTIQPLRDVVQPVVDLAGPIPYPALNSMFDDLYSPGLHHYWKADYVPELNDESIAIHTKYGPKVPSLHSTMHLYPQTGAIQKVGKTDTAYSYRDVEYVHNIIAVDADPSKMDANMAWMQDYWSELHPHAGESAYVNFLMDGEGNDRIKGTYRENYDRLVQVKTAYDPDNLFRVNQNIQPNGSR